MIEGSFQLQELCILYHLSSLGQKSLNSYSFPSTQHQHGYIPRKSGAWNWKFLAFLAIKDWGGQAMNSLGKPVRNEACQTPVISGNPLEYQIMFILGS